MRVEIGGRRRYKAAYQPIERTTCTKCAEKDCQGCIIKDIYDDISNEMELENPYNPAIILNGASNYPYSFRRGLIESLNNGTDVFLSEGTLSKQSFIPAPGMPPQINLSDDRTFEGWKHEN